MTAQTPGPQQVGAWGPTVVGGRRLRALRRTVVVLASVVALGAVALMSTGLLLYRTAERGITRVDVPAVQGEREPASAQHFLLVGSDSREDIDRGERTELHLGHAFGGQRADSIVLVAVRPERAGVNVVSLPRDLLVDDRGAPQKLNETFNEGPNHLVEVLESNFGVPVNNYVEVGVQGFMEVVETIGTVEICLDEELRDAKSGASFDAGCQEMSPRESLSYVRSRQGTRGDFDRIERQQTFMRGMIDEMTDARLLSDVPRLFRVVEEVAANVATDEGLGVGEMRTLAEELRGLVDGEVPMTFVPAYPRRIDGQEFVVAYRPGTEALFSTIRSGEQLESRGSEEERAELAVAVWSGGRAEATEILVDTMLFAGYRDVSGAGSGPEELDAGETTTVYEIDGREEEAGFVAAALGAPIEPLPEDIEIGDAVDVVVAAGDDASS